METGEVRMTDPDQEFDFTAGGLYHPPIASLITGFVRAKIHGLEHQLKSVMTSTDGFFSYEKPPDEMLGQELGMLSAEIGDLMIWRERLYIFDPAVPKHTVTCKPGCDNKHPIYALHGFRAKVDALRRIPLVGGNLYHYTARSVITLKMSTRMFRNVRYAPGTFVDDMDFVLDLRNLEPP